MTGGADDSCGFRMKDSRVLSIGRHCERSEAIQKELAALDCFAFGSQ
jgi:hypothetical protein